jgi:hypothetical protein
VKRRLQRLRASTRVAEQFVEELFSFLDRPDLIQSVKPWLQETANAARKRRAYAPGVPYETLTGGRSGWIPDLVARGWLVIDSARVLNDPPATG